MSRDFYTIRFAGNNDASYKLSSSTLRNDAPNFFTAAFFTSNLTESRSRELLLDRCPELFALIVDHLRGYRILPLTPAALPKRMTLGNAYRNLLADAQFYQLSNLTRDIKKVMRKAGNRSAKSVQRITYVDDDLYTRGAINLRDIRASDIEFRSLGGANSKVLALKSPTENEEASSSSSNKDFIQKRALRPVEIHAQDVQLSLDIHSRNHQVDFDMMFKHPKDHAYFDTIKKLDTSTDWRPHGNIREFELPYTALEIDGIVFAMSDLVDLYYYTLDRSSTSSTNGASASNGSPHTFHKAPPARSYSPNIHAPIPIDPNSSEIHLPLFNARHHTPSASTTPPPPSAPPIARPVPSAERAARLDALIDRVGLLGAIDFVQLHADEVVFMVGNWARGTTARLLKVRARTFRNHAMDLKFFPPVEERRRKLSEDAGEFAQFTIRESDDDFGDFSGEDDGDTSA